MKKRGRQLVAAPALALILTGAQAFADAQFTYDALRRVTTAVYDNDTCLTYSYDANDNRLSQTTTLAGAATTPVWGTGTWGCFSWQ